MLGIGGPTAWHTKTAKSLSLSLVSVMSDMMTGLTVNDNNDDKIVW